MKDDQLLQQVTEKAKVWLGEGYDAETQAAVKAMLENEDKTDLIECFYKDLEFGTGGLRGIMGVGSNRMNIYTVGAATQGLANYLKDAFKDLPEIKVVVGHDVRNNSRLFAEICANIFSANGIKVYLFEGSRPTPEMSFAIRELGCQSGVIITASHNPKEYNGFKITIGTDSFFGKDLEALGAVVESMLKADPLSANIPTDKRAQKFDILSKYEDFYAKNFSHLKSFALHLTLYQVTFCV